MFEHNFPELSHWGILFLGAALIAVGSVGTLLFLRLRKRPIQNADRIDSLKILKTRLAKGEISIDEFNILKATLTCH
jgi:putative membrane protein